MRRFVLLALATAACAAPPTPHSLHGRGLGTTWTATWLSPPELDEDDVADAIVRELAAVDAEMSTWRDDSELALVRAADGPVAVSESTARVVAEALWLAQATGGAFDPTVQPLVELWGFHGPPRTALPTDEELAAARAQVGWERVRVGRDAAGLPTVDAGGTALDLSAIAKGHAVDRVSFALSELGLGDHLVEVGGEVRVHGHNAEGGAWRVGVDRPAVGTLPGADLYAAVWVTNGAVATSGNYRQRYELDGREIHHTLDPRTGWPATAQVASATVLAPDCATADGLATALMVLGAEGLPLIERLPGVEAWLLLPDGDGLRELASSGFELHLVTDPARASAPSRR